MHQCAMMWMFVSFPNSYDEILTHKVMLSGAGVLERWLGQDAEAFIFGITVIIKEKLEVAFSLPSRKTYQESAIHAKRKWAITRQSADTVTLDISTSATVQNEILLQRRYAVYNLLLGKLRRMKTLILFIYLLPDS